MKSTAARKCRCVVPVGRLDSLEILGDVVQAAMHLVDLELLAGSQRLVGVSGHRKNQRQQGAQHDDLMS